jgi:glyoxylase-like metal-dependent hydrolase (beta-lactamase superfamily II)
MGEYLQLSDLNTLVDVGRDERVLGEIRTIRAGIGKKPLDQIFLTHSHFDHAALLKEILTRFDVPVYAHPESRISGIIPLQDGQKVTMGDNEVEVIFAGAHSEDSVCFFCNDNGVLFSGDVPMRIYTKDGVFEKSFLSAFEKIHSYEVKEIMPGHGDPIIGNVRHMLNESYQNLKESSFV